MSGQGYSLGARQRLMTAATQSVAAVMYLVDVRPTNARRRERTALAASSIRPWSLTPGPYLLHLFHNLLSSPGRRRQQRDLKHLVECCHAMERQQLAHILRNVLEIRLVFLRQNDVSDPGAVSAEHFLLHTTDWKHAAAQRDLTRH